MRKVLLALAMLLAAAPAYANGYAPYTTSTDRVGARLASVALNASAGTRTFTLTELARKFSTVVMQVDFTYGAATTVTISCTGSMDLGATFASITVLDTATGTLTILPTITFPTGSVSGNFFAQLAVTGIDQLKCVMSGAGAGSSDFVTVYATDVVGQ